MTLKKGVAILIFLIFTTSAFTQTIITDRPDQTESSSTIPKGSFQIESGILFESIKDKGFSEEILLAPTVLSRYGITKGIEIRLLTEFASVKDKLLNGTVKGITDLQIGTKIQLFKKEGINTEIAVLSHIIVPAAKDDLSINKFGVINKLAISHELSNTIALGYNIGYDYYGTGKGNLTYSLSFGFGITDKIGFYLEPYGSIKEFDNHESNFDTGVTYLINNNFQIDASYGTGINHNMNYISVGMSINILKENKNNI
tara:strand:- start:20223 stop:20993 length:771 start_codon:yes stop_codon:yes gene_type:complete